MPNPKFKIDITARDKTAEALKSASSGFERFTKNTPLEKVSRGLKGLTDKHHALQDFRRSLAGLGDSGAIAGGGIGEAAGGMTNLAAAAGAAGLATAGAAAGLGLAAMAAYKYESAFTKGSAATGRFAEEIGMSAQQLQAFQLAGDKVGVAQDAMAGALKNVGNVMQAAKVGDNAKALSVMTILGVQVHYLKNGSVDAARGMMDLANALQAGKTAAGLNNAQTHQMVDGLFGVGAAASFMNLSLSERNRLIKEGYESPANKSQKLIDESKKFQASVSALNEDWEGLQNTLSEGLAVPGLQKLVDQVDGLATGLTRMLTGTGALNRLLNGTGHLQLDKSGFVVSVSDDSPKARHDHALRGAATGLEAATGSAAGVQAYFVKQGWTPAQAAGIAANLQAESGFDPRAVGDHGEARGIGQWHADRQAAFAAWAGHDIGKSSRLEQLAFVQHELEAGSRKGAGDRLRGATDARQAGAIISRYYESPADVGGQMAARGALAGAIYADNGGKASPAAATQTASNDQPSPIPTSTVSAANGSVHVDINLRGAPPGTIVTAQAKGAGVTSTARIATSMTGSA